MRNPSISTLRIEPIKTANAGLQSPPSPKELELSQSTVRRALQDLRKAGLLETEQRYRKHGGKSSLLYTLKQG